MYVGKDDSKRGSQSRNGIYLVTKEDSELHIILSFK